MRRIVLLYAAFFVLISGCATTPPQPQHPASQLQDLGERCLAAGETASALKYLTEAEQKEPNDASIQYDLGLAYDQRGLQDKALFHLQKALKIKPAYPEALNTMGYIYATRGQFELARGAFQKALEDPFYKTPQYAAFNLGRLYEKNGDLERGLSYYQQAVKFDPKYGMAWVKMGQVLEQLGRTDEARHAYGNAVRTSPDLAEAQLRFGILSYLAGDLEEALHSLSLVGQIAPNTDLADEARKYLDKIDAASLTKKNRPHAAPQIAPSKIETIPSEEFPHQQVKEAPNDEGTPVQGVVAEGRESPSQQYIVQVGSFVDRQKAEETKDRLEAKGYKAVVKSTKHRTLGKVFVIQLEPVNSVSKATTLMTQLNGEIEGEPVIIKVPSR